MLTSVVGSYRGFDVQVYFRAAAAFALHVYEYLEDNEVLQGKESNALTGRARMSEIRYRSLNFS